MSANVAILNVFTDENGNFGNPVGIIMDLEKQLDNKERLNITQGLGFSECVFINDIETPTVSIFNPQEEVSFAGHALLGTAFFIKNILKNNLNTIQSKGAVTKVEFKNDLIWISSELRVLPLWNYEEISDTTKLLNLSNADTKEYEHTYVWSWLDKTQGKIRARTFAPDWGILEDEANGSGTMRLSLILNTNLEVIHGKGSQIFTRILGKNNCSVGGKIKVIKDTLGS